jgi:caa(3)-type oxidase subunit IV
MTERSTSPLTSIIVFVLLVGLTAGTFFLSLLRLGPAGHLAAGLIIAAVQGGLVVLFFMNLVRSPVRMWLVAALGLYWLGIELLLTLNDYITRAAASF